MAHWNRLTIACALCALLAHARPAAADRTVKAASVDAALRAAAQSVEKIGFKRSYFGTFQGTMRVQGTWPVSVSEIYTTTEPAPAGGVRQVERRETRPGEIILDITASPAGDGKVKLNAKLMNPLARRGGRVEAGSAGPPRDWERRLFDAIEQTLASGVQSLPAPQEGGAQKIHDRYRFRVNVDGRRLTVTEVTPGGKAARAGLQPGDEIVKVFDAKPKRDLDLLVFDMFSGHLQHGALVMTVKSASDRRERVVRITDR